MLKLILNDNTEIELADYELMVQFVFIFNSREEFVTTWGKLTPSNLSNVTIQSDGHTIQQFTNLILDSVQAVYNTDSSITGHFFIHGDDIITTKTPEDEEYIQVAKILLGEVV